MSIKTQIIHDLFQIKGGGERLVKTLCTGLPADLVTAHIGKQTFALDDMPGEVLNLDALSGLHGIKTWSLAKAFSRFESSRFYDHTIYSGVTSPLAVHRQKTGRHVFYCHTPPRFVYDQRAAMADAMQPLKRWAFARLINWFQPQYERAVGHMDVLLTNSDYVRERIKQSLNLDAQVVYPPCDTSHFRWKSQGGYFLSLGRHDPLKRIDAVIQAFLMMPDKQLVIASGGSETQRLQQLAAGAPNIRFTGWLSETQLLDLLGDCLATIYVPKDEDFGMTPVESMSAGKPVIASDHGGLLETMLPGETGWLVSSEDLVNDIVNVVTGLDRTSASAMRGACEQRAKDFSTTQFLKKFKEFL